MKTRAGSSMKIRWDRIGGGLAIGALSAAALVGAYEWGISQAPAVVVNENSTGRVVNEDPWNGVPPCTDEIADAGGICHGEPVGIPTPAPTVYVEVPVEVPVPGPTVTAVPPAPAVVVNEDLPPCATEDSDNCYWDGGANGDGRSFVTLHGVTYYQDVPVEDFGSELRTVTLNGETVRYVDGLDAILYCELPLEVGIDEDDNGNQWAGCM